MKEQIIQKMTECDIDFIFANIQGYGDSGDFDQLIAGKFKEVNNNFTEQEIGEFSYRSWINLSDDKFKRCMQEKSCPDELSDLIWEQVYNQMPGFENNEGGGAVLVCSVPHDKLWARGFYNETAQVEAFDREE